MTSTSLNVFRRPDLWSAVIATVALVLSQLPPIADLFKGTKVTRNVSEQAALGHVLGNPGIGFFLSIRNAGGYSVTITKLDVMLTDREEHTIRLGTLAYQVGLNQPSLLGSFTLKAGEHFNENVSASRSLSEADELRVNEVVTAVTASINANLNPTPPRLPLRTTTGPIPVQPAPPRAIADDQVVEKARQLFRDRFPLRPGTYTLIIAALSESTPVAIKAYDFTLFEYGIRALSDLRDYQYGRLLEPSHTTNVFLRPLSEQESAALYMTRKGSDNGRKI